MGIDRFVYWKKKLGPSLKETKATLEDYLGGAALSVTIDVVNDPNRIIALLHGKPSFPFRRNKEVGKSREMTEQHDERWLEVYWTKGSIDVITRMTDEYTNVVAEGFAALCARFWQGWREPM
jgi:hypothetical protein